MPNRLLLNMIESMKIKLGCAQCQHYDLSDFFLDVILLLVSETSVERFFFCPPALAVLCLKDFFP